MKLPPETNIPHPAADAISDCYASESAPTAHRNTADDSPSTWGLYPNGRRCAGVLGP